MVVRALHLGTTSSPDDGPSRAIREKLRPALHKTPILRHFSLAGRTISRAGHSHVATLKPMTPLRPPMQASMKPPSPLLAPQQQPLKPVTPLRPLMQATVKPPSPLLTPQQQPLKPVTPLQPKNTPKTPISHPQRRQGFQPDASSHEQRRHRFQTTAHLACGHALRHQQAPIHPPLRKLAHNSIE